MTIGIGMMAKTKSVMMLTMELKRPMSEMVLSEKQRVAGSKRNVISQVALMGVQLKMMVPAQAMPKHTRKAVPSNSQSCMQIT